MASDIHYLDQLIEQNVQRRAAQRKANQNVKFVTSLQLATKQAFGGPSAQLSFNNQVHSGSSVFSSDLDRFITANRNGDGSINDDDNSTVNSDDASRRSSTTSYSSFRTNKNKYGVKIVKQSKKRIEKKRFNLLNKYVEILRKHGISPPESRPPSQGLNHIASPFQESFLFNNSLQEKREKIEHARKKEMLVNKLADDFQDMINQTHPTDLSATNDITDIATQNVLPTSPKAKIKKEKFYQDWVAVSKLEPNPVDFIGLFCEARYLEMKEKEKLSANTPNKVKTEVAADLLVKLTGSMEKYNDILPLLVDELLNCVYLNYHPPQETTETSDIIAGTEKEDTKTETITKILVPLEKREFSNMTTYVDEYHNLCEQIEDLQMEIDWIKQGVQMKEIVKKFQCVRLVFDPSARFLRDTCFNLWKSVYLRSQGYISVCIKKQMKLRFNVWKALTTKQDMTSENNQKQVMNEINSEIAHLHAINAQLETAFGLSSQRNSAYNSRFNSSSNSIRHSGGSNTSDEISNSSEQNYGAVQNNSGNGSRKNSSNNLLEGGSQVHKLVTGHTLSHLVLGPSSGADLQTLQEIDESKVTPMYYVAHQNKIKVTTSNIDTTINTATETATESNIETHTNTNSNTNTSLTIDTEFISTSQNPPKLLSPQLLSPNRSNNNSVHNTRSSTPNFTPYSSNKPHSPNSAEIIRSYNNSVNNNSSNNSNGNNNGSAYNLTTSGSQRNTPHTPHSPQNTQFYSPKSPHSNQSSAQNTAPNTATRHNRRRSAPGSSSNNLTTAIRKKSIEIALFEHPLYQQVTRKMSMIKPTPRIEVNTIEDATQTPPEWMSRVKTPTAALKRTNTNNSVNSTSTAANSQVNTAENSRVGTPLDDNSVSNNNNNISKNNCSSSFNSKSSKVKSANEEIKKAMLNEATANELICYIYCATFPEAGFKRCMIEPADHKTLLDYVKVLFNYRYAIKRLAIKLNKSLVDTLLQPPYFNKRVELFASLCGITDGTLENMEYDPKRYAQFLKMIGVLFEGDQKNIRMVMNSENRDIYRLAVLPHLPSMFPVLAEKDPELFHHIAHEIMHMKVTNKEENDMHLHKIDVDDLFSLLIDYLDLEYSQKFHTILAFDRVATVKKVELNMLEAHNF